MRRQTGTVWLMAVAYAEWHGIPYQVSEAQDVTVKKISYADNFRYGRPQPWTH